MCFTATVFRKEQAVSGYFRILSVAAGLIVAIAFAPAGLAQDAAADKAGAVFDKGAAQYKALEFRQAKEILLSVDRAKLSAEKQKALDQYLDKVDGAIRQQAAAAEAFKSAERALAANDLAKARDGYAAATANEYFQPAMRDAAKAQLAVVEDRMKKAAAPAPAPAKTDPPVAKVNPPAATAPAPKDDPPAEHRKPAPPVRDNPSILTEAQKQLELEHQEANIEFQKHMTEISERLIGASSEKDFAAAAAACREAKEVLDAHRCCYPNEEFRRRMARVEAYTDEIQKARTQWDERKAETIRSEIVAEEIHREQLAKGAGPRIWPG